MAKRVTYRMSVPCDLYFDFVADADLPESYLLANAAAMVDGLSGELNEIEHVVGGRDDIVLYLPDKFFVEIHDQTEEDDGDEDTEGRQGQLQDAPDGGGR